MRLLLLLSALLTALSGVASPRALAQPVAASAAASIVASPSVAATTASRRFVVSGYAVRPPLRLAMLASAPLPGGRPFYAERRRE